MLRPARSRGVPPPVETARSLERTGRKCIFPGAAATPGPAAGCYKRLRCGAACWGGGGAGWGFGLRDPLRRLQDVQSQHAGGRGQRLLLRGADSGAQPPHVPGPGLCRVPSPTPQSSLQGGVSIVPRVTGASCSCRTGAERGPPLPACLPAGGPSVVWGAAC